MVRRQRRTRNVLDGQKTTNYSLDGSPTKSIGASPQLKFRNSNIRHSMAQVVSHNFEINRHHLNSVSLSKNHLNKSSISGVGFLDSNPQILNTAYQGKTTVGVMHFSPVKQDFDSSLVGRSLNLHQTSDLRLDLKFKNVGKLGHSSRY